MKLREINSILIYYVMRSNGSPRRGDDLLLAYAIYTYVKVDDQALHAVYMRPSGHGLAPMVTSTM
jgi:hypothetical protein